MRHAILPLLLLSLGIVPASDLGAEPEGSARFVRVAGTSKQLADADHATLRIRMRPVATTLEEASGQLDAATVALEARLAEIGMPEGALRMSGISSGRSFEGRVFKGFYAERRAAIRLSDLASRPSLEQALLADELVEVVKVDLHTSKHEELRKASLVSAFEVAKEKADLLAAAAGAELGDVLSIEEQFQERPFWGFGGGITENRIEMPAFGGGDGSELELLEYSMSVSVRFELR